MSLITNSISLAERALATVIQPVTWVVPTELVDVGTKVGFVLAVIWVIYVLAQFALPSRQGGGSKLRRVGVFGFLGAAAVILLLFNLQSLPAVVNWIIQVINWIAALFGSIS